MERLTRYGETTHENGVCCTHFYSKECQEVAGNCAYGCKWEEKAWSKLAEYEDAEEQGLLLRLPCKVGDTVYRFCGAKGRKYVDRRTVSTMTYRLDYNGDIVWEIFTTTTDVLGKTVFLTKAEAEKALAEMGE